MARHHTKDKGDLAVAKVHGVSVSLRVSPARNSQMMRVLPSSSFLEFPPATSPGARLAPKTTEAA
jgi:hypothetical protein